MALLTLLLALPALQDPYATLALEEGFFSEAGASLDADGDGALDVVSGPFWWAGPSFEERFRFRTGEAFDTNGYSQHFLNWGEDVDGDGDVDLVLLGFPGQEALWYENPGSPREVEAWRRHLIHPGVGKESPAFADLDGDGRRDLVFHSEGAPGRCSIPTEEPTQPWPFHTIDAGTGPHHFTHGLGVVCHRDVVAHHGQLPKKATSAMAVPAGSIQRRRSSWANSCGCEFSGCHPPQDSPPQGGKRTAGTQRARRKGTGHDSSPVLCYNSPNVESSPCFS